ncbi:unnamed protein product [Acanthosepion pharaonis]|uniref:Uncharacterized protein n=1 Tax=Acanthosepion pharaonis TaxID=158019 RepID=A0A812B9W8_ACAPH|nr:unnamed protein product [Sepia pharaonis]
MPGAHTLKSLNLASIFCLPNYFCFSYTNCQSCSFTFVPLSPPLLLFFISFFFIFLFLASLSLSFSLSSNLPFNFPIILFIIADFNSYFTYVFFLSYLFPLSLSLPPCLSLPSYLFLSAALHSFFSLLLSFSFSFKLHFYCSYFYLSLPSSLFIIISIYPYNINDCYSILISSHVLPLFLPIYLFLFIFPISLTIFLRSSFSFSLFKHYYYS